MKFYLSVFILILLIVKGEQTILEDSLLIPQSICVDNGSHIFLSKNVPKNLIGWFTFDDDTMNDYSGNGLTGKPIPKAGPPKFIKGYSAYFDGTNNTSIKNFSSLAPSDLTISFWIYLLEDSTGNWRTLLHKGSLMTDLTPTIILWPKERQLHVRVGTEVFWNEGLESNGKLSLKQWTHISVSFSGQMIQLFINGNKDNQIILDGKILFNNGPLHLGKDPWRPGVKCYIDDLKLYNYVLNEKEIQQEAINSNLLITPYYVNLGCKSCSYLQAISSCKLNFHLCTYTELFSGAYLTARKNGYFKCNTEVWAKESADAEGNTNVNLEDSTLRKLSLCCSD